MNEVNIKKFASTNSIWLVLVVMSVAMAFASPTFVGMSNFFLCT